MAVYRPAWIVLAGWMRILSSDFLSHFPGRVVNLHPALPGTFPGTQAIQRAFEAYQRGEIQHTGVMVHLVPDEGVDNGPTLATVSLRPHLIWGPGDNHLVPRIVAQGKAGKLRRIGNRPCLVDTVYVDNAARAHLLAADRLAPGAPLAGRPYFITNGEPIPLWEMVDQILAAAGLPPVTRQVSPRLAYAAGVVCEKLWTMFRLAGEPPMTRFVASELTTAHWFDISAARRDFGYVPEVTLAEGLECLHVWFAGGKP